MTRFPRLLTAVALAALIPSVVGGQSSRYPAREVSLIVPADPGSGLDLLGRAFAKALKGPLGQPIVVQNVPGASSTGLVRLHDSRPDGYTLGVVGSFALTTPLSGAVVFRPTDLTYLAHLAKDTFVLAVPANSPYRSPRDYAAASSGVVPPLAIAVAGKGTLSHVAAASLAQVGAVNLTIVPSVGSMASLGAILNGTVASAILVQSEVTPHLGHDRGPRVLATFGDVRSAKLPDIPTAAEQNMSGLPTGPWRGLAAPPGLPEPIRSTLAAAITNASEDPEWKAFVQRQGLTGRLLTGAELDRYLDAETGALRLTMQSLGLLTR
jgi:putative tricarboxylic transport membrane protein